LNTPSDGGTALLRLNCMIFVVWIWRRSGHFKSRQGILSASQQARPVVTRERLNSISLVSIALLFVDQTIGSAAELFVALRSRLTLLGDRSSRPLNF
jgi:hypothetical protein